MPESEPETKINMVTILMYVDNTNILIAGFVKAKVLQALERAHHDAKENQVETRMTQPLSVVRPNIYGNDDTPMTDFILPGVIMLAMQFAITILSIYELNELIRSQMFRSSLAMARISRCSLLIIWFLIKFAMLIGQTILFMIILISIMEIRFETSGMTLFITLSIMQSVLILMATIILMLCTSLTTTIVIHWINFIIAITLAGLIFPLECLPPIIHTIMLYSYPWTSIAESMRSAMSRGWSFDHYFEHTQVAEFVWLSINLSAIIPQTNIGNYRDCCDPDNNSNDQTTSTISCSIQMDQISTQHNNSSSSSSLSTEQSSSTTMDHHHHVANMNNNDNHSYRSRNSITSILNFYRRNSNNLIFDANTFKQVKRLYCGMLLVAIAYSVTMVIMMMVLYKSLPESTYNNYRQQQQYHRINEHKSESQSQPKITTVATILTDKESVSVSSSLPPSPLSPPVENESSEIIKNNRLWMMDTSGQTLYRHYNQQYGNRQASTSYVNRTQLDQVIAINFLTTILYIMAFYAAQREFYHLTLAFTTTLAVSMSKFVCFLNSNIGFLY